MMNNFRELVESNRHSNRIYWKHLIRLKDFLGAIKRNDSIFAFPLQLFYYISLFVIGQKKGKRKKNIVAIILSWKRVKNLPQVVFGLKRQSCINDIIILHNHPSKLWIPGCKNIFFKDNHGSIIRHQFAATLEEYDYFIFSDDDLMLNGDFSKELLQAMKSKGDQSILGFFGQQLNFNNRTNPYSTGKHTISKEEIKSVDIIKGRFL